jgi:hypothetical protein
MGTNVYKNNGGHAILVAPTTSWGDSNNGLQGSAGMLWPMALSATAFAGSTTEMILETTTIAWASEGAGGAISCRGWEDNI